MIKLFEIRDRGTFIPVAAFKFDPQSEAERHLLACAGYGQVPLQQREYVLLCQIDGGGGRVCSDPFDWPGEARTLPAAHAYIQEHWDALQSGEVVDVEFILGETTHPKPPQRSISSF